MAQWNWDFGFDWNSALYPEGATKRYLMHGVVDAAELHANKKSNAVPALRPPGAPFDLSKEDTMTFSFYNVTHDPGSGYEIEQVKIRFFNAMSAQPFVLFQTQGTEINLSGVSQVSPNAASAIFSVSKTGTNFPILPRYPVTTVYKVRNDIADGTRVLFDVEIKVKKGNEQRLFYVDPEMVFGGMGAYLAANAKRFAS